MKPTAIIHIGAEKTGSTSIQEFLGSNTIDLFDRGIYIPGFLGVSNHRLFPFLAYANTREDEFTIWNRLAPGSRRRQDVHDKTHRKLLRMTRRYAGMKWIISSEHIHSRLTTTEEILRFKQLLDTAFSSYSLLFYARKPIDLAVSLFSTAVKDGHYLDDLPSANHPYWSYLCNYQKSISQWLAIFGRSSISIRIFDKSQFKSGSLIYDFCNSVNIEYSSSLMIPSKMNQSLSLPALRLLNGLNKIRSDKNLSTIYSRSSNQKMIVSLFEKNYPYDGAGYIPSAAQISDYSNVFSSSNQWILENFSTLDKCYWDDSFGDSDYLTYASSLRLSESEEQLLNIVSQLLPQLGCKPKRFFATKFINSIKNSYLKIMRDSSSQFEQNHHH